MKTTIELMGNWTNTTRKWGYTDLDYGILTSEKGRGKISRILNAGKLEHEFRFIFLRGPRVHKYTQVGLTDTYNKDLEIDITPSDDKITVIFTNNKGTERIPMTAWCIMHRLSHCLTMIGRTSEYHLYDKLCLYIKSAYGLPHSFNFRENSVKSILSDVLTMRSAREHNLVSAYECLNEIFAQNALYGTKFNNFKHVMKKSNKKHFGRNYDFCYAQRSLETIQEDFENIIEQYIYTKEDQLIQCYGRVVVM